MPSEQPPYKFGECAVARLQFDRSNPRLPAKVNGGDVEDVLGWLLADAGLLSLMESIGAQGYFPGDPLLVSPADEGHDLGAPFPSLEEGKWTVVEGNRRLAAITLLSNPELAPRRRRAVQGVASRMQRPAPGRVPVVAFRRRDDVLTYLGFRHITGVKEWDPLEKARFLTDLRDRAKVAGTPHDNRTLARQIGSTGPYVGRLLVAYELIGRLEAAGFFGPRGVDDVPFSLLALALNYDKIVDFLGIRSPDNPDLVGLRDDDLKHLATWLYSSDADGKTALGDSRNMRLLSLAVAEPRAVQALVDGTPLKQAVLLAESPERLVSEALREAAARVTLAAGKAGALTEAPIDAPTYLEQIASGSAEVRRRLDTLALDET